ncbi:MAG: hypothetical protein OTJ45_05795 [Alphaproteobacteria bacterium]|nr:hypothetical protein [Alphaproteobacteria bacterium]
MDYDLGLFTVLVADDNAYMRSLLKSLMHVIGVGTVIAVADGSEAIETLKKVGQDPLKGGINSIDIIWRTGRCLLSMACAYYSGSAAIKSHQTDSFHL